MRMKHPKSFGTYLLYRGVCSRELLERATRHTAVYGGRLGTNLVELGYLDIEELERQLAVLPTREIAAVSWGDNGRVYVADHADEAIDLSMDELQELADPEALVGRAPGQVERFLRDRVEPALEDGGGENLGPAELRV